MTKDHRLPPVVILLMWLIPVLWIQACELRQISDHLEVISRRIPMIEPRRVPLHQERR